MDKGIAIHDRVSLHVKEEGGISQGQKDSIRTGHTGDNLGESSDEQQSPHTKNSKVKHNHITPSSTDWSFPIW